MTCGPSDCVCVPVPVCVCVCVTTALGSDTAIVSARYRPRVAAANMEELSAPSCDHVFIGCVEYCG